MVYEIEDNEIIYYYREVDSQGRTVGYVHRVRGKKKPPTFWLASARTMDPQGVDYCANMADNLREVFHEQWKEYQRE